MKTYGITTDVLVIGGGVGGVAAALSLLQRGVRVVLAEESDWLGGQMTSQAVPPDEHAWIETEGGTALYREFRNRVRSYYQRNYPLASEEISNRRFNPGRAGVSTLSHEPRVAQLVLEEMLAAGVSMQQLEILFEVRPFNAEVTEGQIQAVCFEQVRTGERIEVEARFVLDASETGEFLSIAGIDHVTGAEGSAETGEPSSTSEVARPENMQAITWVAALGFDPNCPVNCDRYRIPKPNLYEFWRNYSPNLSPEWPGGLLEWRYTSPFTLAPIEGKLFPNFWGYRRVIARENFKDALQWKEASILNWPQNDYFEHEVVLCDRGERERRYERARELSLSWVYWLQTEAPRSDGGCGHSGLYLRPDITGTRDGLAKAPYIREARRIRSLYNVSELDIGVMARGGVSPDGFFDTVGTGYYRIDLHPTTGGDNYVDIEAFPFQIPMGALISPQLRNFLAAGKTMGTTHLANGCYRLHPVEWNVGESAGALAAECLRLGCPPHAIRKDARKLADFQQQLARAGVSLSWSVKAMEEHRAKISAHLV